MDNKQKLSPERQAVADQINQMMDEGYGCAESFIKSTGEHLFGNLSPEIIKISTGFSGGVGGTHEELCGGISGAAVIVGLLYGRTTNDEALMIRCKRLISEHRDRFIQEFGTTVCQELRDAQFGADEDNPCSAMITPAAFMLLDILEEEKEREELAKLSMEQDTGITVKPLEEYQQDHQDDPSDDLLKELDRAELGHEHRNWIGVVLDSRGDQRPGVGLNNDGLPDIEWCYIPAGTVQVEREGEFQSEAFYLAKYPVTFGQYQAFLEDYDGYKNPSWWKGLACDEKAEKGPGQQRFQHQNHPRDNVSWFDALAFCRWLTAKAGKEISVPLSKNIKDTNLKNWEIRLPTEWEWQMAATGGNPDHKFPWGLDWDDNKAHTKHNQLNKSTAVGLYPGGVSPTGVWDMSGNIWEWCLNCYQDPSRIDLSRPDRRVLRGGSWYHWGSYAHTTMRSRYFPDHRYNAGGFRLAWARKI